MTNMNPQFSDKDSLKELIEKRISYHREISNRNYHKVQALLGIAITCSVLAALSSALEWDKYLGLSKALTTILAGIPALALTIQARFKFEDKSFYHDAYRIKLESALRKLSFGAMGAKDVVDLLDQIDKEMEYPRIADSSNAK